MRRRWLQGVSGVQASGLGLGTCSPFASRSACAPLMPRGHSRAYVTSEYQVVVDDLVKKAPFAKVVQELENDSRVRLPLGEYLATCKKSGVNEKDARQLLRALHDSGRVLHYENVTALADVVLTKPQEITGTLAKILDSKGEHAKAFREQKQQELLEYQKQFEALHAKKSELDRIAQRKADTTIALLFGYLILQGAFVARLTWWELSWDVMEPVTYMLTFTTGVGGMAWFMSTKGEYTYEGLRKRLTDRKTAKVYAKNNFNLEQYKELERLISKTSDELAAPELTLLTRNTV